MSAEIILFPTVPIVYVDAPPYPRTGATAPANEDPVHVVLPFDLPSGLIPIDECAHDIRSSEGDVGQCVKCGSWFGRGCMGRDWMFMSSEFGDDDAGG